MAVRSGDASIIDSRFDGAYFGGIQATNGRFRIEGDGLWAAVGGDRPDTPVLEVDADAVYFHAAASVRVVNDLYLGAGVRRLALKYNIRLGDLEPFERKPGLWDPLVGVSWHSYPNDSFEFHANFDVGGFGVGTAFETSTGARVDWKPFRHFGLTAGYSLLYFKVEHTVREPDVQGEADHPRSGRRHRPLLLAANQTGLQFGVGRSFSSASRRL